MSLGQRVRIALYLVAGLCGAWVLLRADRPDVDAVLWQRQVTAMHRQAQQFHAKQDSLTHLADSLQTHVNSVEQRAALLNDRARSLNNDVRAAKAALAAAGTVADSLQRALGVIVAQGSVIGAQVQRIALDSTALAASARLAAILQTARDSAVGRADSLQTLVDKAPHPKRGINRTIVFVGGVIVGHLLLH